MFQLWTTGSEWASGTLPAQYRVHSAFHVSLLKPFSHFAPDPVKSKVPPPPEIIEEPTVYQVREILDSRQRGGHLEYLIDWEGYGPEERSWVTRDGVLDPSLLTDYHHSLSDRPVPRGRPCHRVEEGVLSGNQPRRLSR